jgi:[ribosomal protein S5]-alanine N-acetyltransferase
MPPTATIATERLDLITLPPAFLAASLAMDRARAEAWLGLSIPREWFDETGLMRLRLADLERDPALQPWLLRAIGLRAARQMVGHIGFHTAPGPAYLEDLAPGGVEFGYTVFPVYRRQGIAREAAGGLMRWAHTTCGVERFVLSISPDNVPSLRLAASFGFRPIGSHVDEEDGVEEIFEMRMNAAREG